MSAKATATHVNSYLGNNGKISFKYDMTPATVDTKAKLWPDQGARGPRLDEGGRV
ncbi:MAG: hypothetical protein ACLUSU_05915 [Collinsella sp.]